MPEQKITNLRVNSAEEIVRRLAAIEDPSVEDRDYAPASVCGLCGSDSVAAYQPMTPDLHSIDCPWIQAKQWVADHGRQRGVK